MSRTPPWMVGVKERERERERERKRVTVYGVFVYSGGEDGGFVVRQGETLQDGRYYFPSPYGQQTPKYVSKSRKLADRKATDLNDRKFGAGNY